MNQRIKANSAEPPKESNVKAGRAEAPKCCTFSFRFWSQIEYFGVPRKPGWYVSVLDRLQYLSTIEIDSLQDPSLAHKLRYHEIDWNARNVPVRRTDFRRVPPDYLNNEAEYPFVQFQISKAVGRVVGFWDENDVFNIVVFDPLHNIQPSKKVGYTVRPSPPLDSEYTMLLRHFDAIKGRHCPDATCQLKIASQGLPTHHATHEVMAMAFMTDTLSAAEPLLEAGRSLSEIFEAGIITLLDKEGGNDARGGDS